MDEHRTRRLARPSPVAARRHHKSRTRVDHCHRARGACRSEGRRLSKDSIVLTHLGDDPTVMTRDDFEWHARPASAGRLCLGFARVPQPDVVHRGSKSIGDRRHQFTRTMSEAHLHGNVAPIRKSCDAGHRARAYRVAHRPQQPRDAVHRAPKLSRIPDVDGAITSTRVNLPAVCGPARLRSRYALGERLSEEQCT